MNKELLEKYYPNLIKYYEEGDCCSEILKLRKEIERLNNIINELETIIKTHYIVGYEIVNNILDDILLKLKELKEDNKNV